MSLLTSVGRRRDRPKPTAPLRPATCERNPGVACVFVSPSLPLSARFALWFSAFAAGRASLDEARDRVVGDDAAHDVVGCPTGTSRYR